MSRKKKVKKAVRKTPAKKIRKPKEPKVGTYNGIEYESFCELSFLYFAEELIKLGYASAVRRSKSYSLCEPVISSYAVQLKTKGSKQETQTISQGVTYTPDYDIYFTPKALGIFCWELGSSDKWDKNLLVVQESFSIDDGGAIQALNVDNHGNLIPYYKACVEVKPDFSRNSSTPKSVQSMKWLYQRHKVFVNLFRPNKIFEGLFVPEKYKLTERGTPRLLKFKVKNIHEYLKSKK